jgi:prepilin signal peptidase PulO-like enzyme (type II secretory pathway)
MIRAPFYAAILITAIVALWLAVRAKKVRIDVVATYPILILTTLYAAIMVGRTVSYWSDSPWHDPPMSTLMAAIANGILWGWVATVIVIMRDRING